MRTINTVGDIKPINTEQYRLVVMNKDRGHFIIERLSDGRLSPLYTERMSRDMLLYAYECFDVALNTNEGMFNNMCERVLT